MILAEPNKLSRAEIKQAFRRNRGAASELAKELGVHRCRITAWMKNRNDSKRVDAAIRQRAAELINAERAEAEKR